MMTKCFKHDNFCHMLISQCVCVRARERGRERQRREAGRILRRK